MGHRRSSRRVPALFTLALAACLCLVGATPALAGVPVTGDGFATNVTETSATLNANIADGGEAATYRFDYGTTDAYGNTTGEVAASSGQVSQPISGLSPGTNYEFRITVTNASGSDEGFGSFQTADRDTDGDGVPNSRDQCPTVSGSQSNGCPPPDDDGDGLPNSFDRCPTQAGPQSNGGCPIPNRDGDGFRDDNGSDLCPSVPGPRNGCPNPGTPRITTNPATNISLKGWTGNATVNPQGRGIDYTTVQAGLFRDFRLRAKPRSEFGATTPCRQDTGHIDGTYGSDGVGKEGRSPDVPVSCRFPGDDGFMRQAAAVDYLPRVYYRALLVWNDGSQNPGQDFPGPDQDPNQEGGVVTPPRGQRIAVGEIRSFAIPGLNRGGICKNLDAFPVGPGEHELEYRLYEECGIGGNAEQRAAALSRALSPRGAAAKIGAILKAGGYPAKFVAPKAGTAKIVWRARKVGAGAAAKRRPVVVAAGSKKVRKAGKAVIKLRLTKKGKALLRKAKRTKSKVKITAKGSFNPKTGKTKTAVAKFKLKR